MAASRWTDEHADPRSLVHALLGELHGLLSDALTMNQAVLFPSSEPEQLTRIYTAASSTIGDAHALVERLDEEMLRDAGVPVEMLELMQRRWSQDKTVYESQPTRRPSDLAHSLRTADTLLLHDLTAVLPRLREIRGWLRLVLSELHAPGGTAPEFSPSHSVIDAPLDPMATSGSGADWRVDERTDGPILESGGRGR